MLGIAGSCRAQAGSSRGQIAKKCPLATKFGWKKPWLKCYALIAGVNGYTRVNQGQLEVKLLGNALCPANLLGRNLDHSIYIMHCWDQMLCRC